MGNRILENEALKENFDTLLQASENGQVCLVDCIDKRTNEHVPVICIISKNDNAVDENDIEMLPFAVMFTENPYEFLIPPNQYEKLEDIKDVRDSNQE